MGYFRWSGTVAELKKLKKKLNERTDFDWSIDLLEDWFISHDTYHDGSLVPEDEYEEDDDDHI
jgi:hypothetical protein